ncbi:MAG: SAM-dependent methyltransferase [Tannerella sp.]|nr:SAM-dependent methyltransferase [Tannerella sp.]
MAARLYLIPVPLSETSHEKVLPTYNREIILSLKYFIVENVRTARRFLKKTEPSIQINELHFMELNEHTGKESVAQMLQPMKEGFSIGVMSEAGCPAIADPGADIVALAQSKGFRTVPLVGPSSVLMALMASGFNGQSFAFHGYLPVEQSKRIEKIKFYESRMYAEDETQIFIETPYRNNKLLEDLIKTCKPSTKLCIASKITHNEESIQTLPAKEWTKIKPDLNRKPAIFLMYH